MDGYIKKAQIKHFLPNPYGCKRDSINKLFSKTESKDIVTDWSYFFRVGDKDENFAVHVNPSGFVFLFRGYRYVYVRCKPVFWDHLVFLISTPAERIRHADNIFLIFTEVNAEETVELKFSRPRLRISAWEMNERLKRANLESAGYKKIVYSGTVQTAKETKQLVRSLLCVLFFFWWQVMFPKIIKIPQ